MGRATPARSRHTPCTEDCHDHSGSGHKSKALTAYKEFPGRSHFLLGQPGWEAVADFALEWALAPRELDE